MAAKKDELAAKKDKLAAKNEALSANVIASKDAFVRLNGYETHISHMMATLKLFEIILQICSTMSQAEATITRSDATEVLCKEFIARNFGSYPNFAGIPEELSSLDKNRTRLSYKELMSTYPRKLDPGELNPEELEQEELKSKELNPPELDPGRLALNQFALYWKALILNCYIIRKSSKTTKKRVVTVMKEIEASVNDSTWPNQEKAHPFPGLVSQEVNAVQPLIFGLLGALGKCCKVNIRANRLSLAKTEIEVEVTVAATETRKKRKMDGCAGKPGRRYPVNMDTSMKLPIEVKPFTRKSVSFEKLDEESRNQITGHITKYGHQGLSGGTSTWATGVTANPAYIIVYRLIVLMEEYCGDGKPFVKLQLVESFKLPLMTLECFESWIAKCKAANPKAFTPKLEEEINRLKGELYGTAEAIKTSVDVYGVPLGIWVLWDLLQKRRIDLFGPDYEKLIRSGGNINVGELLGTGSFGLVFSYQMEGETHASAVLKVPILQKCTHLERELKILQHLEREEDPDTTIDEGIALPVVMKVLHNLPVVLGGVKQQLKGLVLRPQGMPLTFWIRAIMEEAEGSSVLRGHVIQVWSQLKAALEFMHEKNVFHNDVTPKNIVVCDTADWSVCLVDFGSAFLKDGNDKKMTGFEGTPNYAHLDIFKSYPNKVWAHQDGSYDFFGLTLTSIVMFNEGEACWDMKPFPALITKDNRNELCKLLEERKKKAIAMIHESGCSWELQTEWKDHIETERLTDFCRSIHDPAAAASGEDASLQVPFQETEAEAPRHPPTRTGLRSSTQRMEVGTIGQISSGPLSKKRRRTTDQEPTVASSKRRRRR